LYESLGLPSREYGDKSPGTTPYNLDSLLLSHSWVTEDGGAVAKAKFTEIIRACVEQNTFFAMYQVGGKVTEVPTDKMSVTPAFRSAALDFISFEPIIKLMRPVASGVDFNHHGPFDLTNEQLWGSNSERLERLKEKYDPKNRFNCYQCVGYQPPYKSCDMPEVSMPLESMPGNPTEADRLAVMDILNENQIIQPWTVHARSISWVGIVGLSMAMLMAVAQRWHARAGTSSVLVLQSETDE